MNWEISIIFLPPWKWWPIPVHVLKSHPSGVWLSVQKSWRTGLRAEGWWNINHTIHRKSWQERMCVGCVMSTEERCPLLLFILCVCVSRQFAVQLLDTVCLSIHYWPCWSDTTISVIRVCVGSSFQLIWGSPKEQQRRQNLTCSLRT